MAAKNSQTIVNISALFIRRPVATCLLIFAILFVGTLAFALLPVAPLPQVDFPSIRVAASLPGASPETMAATVATPLEQTLGRIAGITEMTSQSSLGNTSIVLQFDLERNIDGAARDVQAAINAARSLLPALPKNPSYRKMNPADAPIMILALTSPTIPLGVLYDTASTVLAQKISQLPGVGQVQISGSSLPAIRAEIDPLLLKQSGLSLLDLRTSIKNANVNMPKGILDDGEQQWLIGSNDKLQRADEFSRIIIRNYPGDALRLKDVGSVFDGEQDSRTLGLFNGKPAVLLIVFKQAGANVIETVERIKKNMPQLKAWTPGNADLDLVLDRSPSIKASLRDVELTLVVAMCLVILVVFLFLRDKRATGIPAIAVPVSLLGAFAVMYLLGYSLNHLSLMALTIATGFVVDDAIVVTENIVRYLENGFTPLQAALRGSHEVVFTVISISISLIAIFIPILAMGGLLGRLFKEFAVTLSAAVLVSLFVSLSATPMMCAQLLRRKDYDSAKDKKNRRGNNDSHALRKALDSVPTRRSSRFSFKHCFSWLDTLHEQYALSLIKVLDHKKMTLCILIGAIALNVYLYIIIPKGFFPTQDTGQIVGMAQADQAISFQAMRIKFLELMDIVRNHPAIATVGGFTGGMQNNTGMMFISLKPRHERHKNIDEVISDLRQKLAGLPGTQLRLQAIQDIGMGGRRSRASYQYTLQGDNLRDLRKWHKDVLDSISLIKGVVDINSDQETRGLQTTVQVDRDALGRFNVGQKQLDASLSLAFSQSFTSTIYTGGNQYRVVMELSPEYLEDPINLDRIYVPVQPVKRLPPVRSSPLGSGEAPSAHPSEDFGRRTGQLALRALGEYLSDLTSLSVAHQGQMAASTISFNILPGYTFSEIQERIETKVAALNLPSTIVCGFQGSAKIFASSISKQPLLIAAALITLYIVLGILYESLIHPLTILSTLPSAGLGAMISLLLFGQEFSVIAFIGVLLLCGIVIKNAIMMIDFAISAKRQGNNAQTAIYHACLLRFRPIMMTTVAAIFGAFPLILNFGEGAEMRAPLGIAIVGGLLLSQLLTLYTTPVIYLYLDRFTKRPNLSYSSEML